MLGKLYKDHNATIQSFKA